MKEVQVDVERILRRSTCQERGTGEADPPGILKSKQWKSRSNDVDAATLQLALLEKAEPNELMCLTQRRSFVRAVAYDVHALLEVVLLPLRMK